MWSSLTAPVKPQSANSAARAIDRPALTVRHNILRCCWRGGIRGALSNFIRAQRPTRTRTRHAEPLRRTGHAEPWLLDQDVLGVGGATPQALLKHSTEGCEIALTRSGSRPDLVLVGGLGGRRGAGRSLRARLHLGGLVFSWHDWTRPRHSLVPTGASLASAFAWASQNPTTEFDAGRSQNSTTRLQPCDD
jgi:hypothetical protein